MSLESTAAAAATTAPDAGALKNTFMSAKHEHVSVPVAGALAVARQLECIGGRILNPTAAEAPIFVSLGSSLAPCIIELQERIPQEMDGHEEQNPSDIGHIQDPGVAHAALSFDNQQRYEAAVSLLKRQAECGTYPSVEVHSESEPDDSHARKYFIVVVGGKGGVAIQLIWRRGGSLIDQNKGGDAD